MRSYDVAIASLAIDAPVKWTDNVLSQHSLTEVVSGRRGVARRISYSALVRLALIRQLHAQLGLGVGDSVRLSGELLESGGNSVHLSGHLQLTFDRSGLERSLDIRLSEVLESAPAPSRGRPPTRLPRT